MIFKFCIPRKIENQNFQKIKKRTSERYSYFSFYCTYGGKEIDNDYQCKDNFFLLIVALSA